MALPTETGAADEEALAPQLVVVLNWFEERLVPGGR